MLLGGVVGVVEWCGGCWWMVWWVLLDGVVGVVEWCGGCC